MHEDLRLPNITGANEREQIRQIKSYLYQLVEQLNVTLTRVNNDSESIVKQITGTSVKTDDAKKAQDTFNSIKSLIIKSAEIVDAYSTIFTAHFDGLYVAKSAFGDYTAKTDSRITVNEEKISTNYTKLEVLEPTVDGLSNDMRQYKGRIVVGEVGKDENDNPRYGLFIGEEFEKLNEETGEMERVFKASARFTSDKLSFYDANDIEVAYISNYRLYITNVEIKGKLKHGGYEIDATDGLAYKWVGRS